MEEGKREGERVRGREGEGGCERGWKQGNSFGFVKSSTIL